MMVKMSIKRTEQSKMFMNLTVLKLAAESTESAESSYWRKGQIHKFSQRCLHSSPNYE